MKIYRGPRTTKKWQVTDTKPVPKWAEKWEPGAKVLLDGTIKKAGERHTDLGVEIESDDIIALSNALMRSQKSRIAALETQAAKQSEIIDLLETALQKIESLLSYHREKAPNQEELLDTVQKVAEHFAGSHTRTKPIKLDWIKWDSV